ncbi:signal peptidase I [Leucobacter sp. CSA1]|uniref:Signal peptidase I n=1 Tax=Leucobacter chromiisoli TaxID=2796471 RepID=A0A934Q8X8_9MICO|nr:signal peptidase I [Leucobacter chromiisoli]MBK0419470.1 signal peptidase I [Leucobacter chromiisoli]
MTEERRSPVRRALSHPLTHLIAATLILALTQAFVVKLFRVPSGSMEQTLEIGDRIFVNRLAYGAPVVHGTPDNGDIVVFHTQDDLWPRSSDTSNGSSALDGLKHAARWALGDVLGFGPGTRHMIVKRVIGTPGQTVECCDAEGRLMIDGVPLDEPYVFEDLPFVARELDCETEQRSSRCFPPIEVPADRLLVLGDHRGASSDAVSHCRAGTEPTGAECVRWVRTEDVIGEVLVRVWPLGSLGGVE